jgi:hypothetical protein
MAPVGEHDALTAVHVITDVGDLDTCRSGEEDLHPVSLRKNAFNSA